ncbi:MULTISPECIES: hypothetical protein [unclassified Frankia]|uniref:hypothetical protein n=1 Tax=unclassified Frankia TaxID=2632575 RepID=UPI002AD3A21D|nr:MULTISPECIES: hypothetical protein [unclassified Frankia]
MANDEPGLHTVLLKFLEVLELTVRTDLDGQDATTNTQIINSKIQSLVQNIQSPEGLIMQKEVAMGDNYTVGQAGAVGPNAHGHDNTFSQAWTQGSKEIDLPSLKRELSALRSEMKARATEPEHDVAVAEIAQAEVAASKGDGQTVMTHLAHAGKWALGIASAIGAALAASAIGSAIGS